MSFVSLQATTVELEPPRLCRVGAGCAVKLVT